MINSLRRRIFLSFRLYWRCLIRGLKRCLTYNKPIHYLEDYDDLLEPFVTHYLLTLRTKIAVFDGHIKLTFFCCCEA